MLAGGELETCARSEVMREEGMDGAAAGVPWIVSQMEGRAVNEVGLVMSALGKPYVIKGSGMQLVQWQGVADDALGKETPW